MEKGERIRRVIAWTVIALGFFLTAVLNDTGPKAGLYVLLAAIALANTARHLYLLRAAPAEARARRRAARIARRREAAAATYDGFFGPTTPFVGKRCLACESRIVVAKDGAACTDCGGPVHVACIAAHRGEAHAGAAPYR